MIQHDPAEMLARYVAEERPPPKVDAIIRARLQRQAQRRGRSTYWLGVYMLAAAALLMFWVIGPSTSSLRTGADASTAIHSMDPIDKRGLLDVPQRRPHPPTSHSASTLDDPGVVALREARELLHVKALKLAYERLEPCLKTVGDDDLLEECEFIVVQALCGVGDIQEGRRRIAAFHDQWPRSSHARALTELCRD